MQKNRFWIVVLCFALAGSEAFSAIVTSTFLVPLRTAITDEIAFVSSDITTSNTAALRPLRQAERALGRRGRLTTSTELAQLAAASTVLLRSEYADLFSPLIDEAVSDYVSALQALSDSIAASLDALPQSSQVLAAQRSLDLLDDLLDRAETAANPEISTRLLSRAAVQLTALQTTVARLSRNGGSGNTASGALTAFVNGERFSADGIPTATFNPGIGALSFTGSQTTGNTTRTITISITDVRPGTTTHFFGGLANGTFATYNQRGTNVIGLTSASGSVTVTVNLSAQTASGTFSFLATSSTGQDSPVQISGGRFNLPLR